MKYIAFDLDRVLFDTDAFTNDITDISHELCGVPRQQFADDATRYRVIGMHGLRHYDYAAQIAGYGVSINDIYPKVLREIGRLAKQYVYPDVAEVLARCDTDQDNTFILTYGDDMYQRLKLEVSPQLHDIKSRIVLEPKGQYISASLPKSEGVLFDDTPQEWLPSGWEHVLIDRSVDYDDALLCAVMNYKQK